VFSKAAFTLLLLCGACAAPPRHADLPPAIEPSPKTQLDILEAAVRSRLAKAPLPRGETLYLFLNDDPVPGLSARFTEYRVRIRSGSTGPSPPRARWYWLDLGRVTADTAFVTLDDATVDGMLALNLQKHDHRWVVADEHPFLLARATSPNHAMERTAGSFGSSLFMKFHPQPAAACSPASRRSSYSR
jgi:hypothetical protein